MSRAKQILESIQKLKIKESLLDKLKKNIDKSIDYDEIKPGLKLIVSYSGKRFLALLDSDKDEIYYYTGNDNSEDNLRSIYDSAQEELNKLVKSAKKTNIDFDLIVNPK